MWVAAAMAVVSVVESRKQKMAAKKEAKAKQKLLEKKLNIQTKRAQEGVSAIQKGLQLDLTTNKLNSILEVGNMDVALAESGLSGTTFNELRTDRALAEERTASGMKYNAEQQEIDLNNKLERSRLSGEVEALNIESWKTANTPSNLQTLSSAVNTGVSTYNSTKDWNNNNTQGIK